MLDHSDTVMTEGIQLWLTQTADQCGWPFQSAITTSYADRADTYSNMSQLLCRERWSGRDRPREVAYLCGVIDHDGVSTQQEADARVRENALGFLQINAKPVWPELIGADGRFDWSALCAANDEQGESRLDCQFLRANFQPTERYVMTRAGVGPPSLGGRQVRLSQPQARRRLDEERDRRRQRRGRGHVGDAGVPRDQRQPQGDPGRARVAG